MLLYRFFTNMNMAGKDKVNERTKSLYLLGFMHSTKNYAKESSMPSLNAKHH